MDRSGLKRAVEHKEYDKTKTRIRLSRDRLKEGGLRLQELVLGTRKSSVIPTLRGKEEMEIEWYLGRSADQVAGKKKPSLFLSSVGWPPEPHCFILP